jgi:hypothetical protein
MNSRYGSKIWISVGMAILAAMVIVASLFALAVVTYYSRKYNWQ